MAALVYQHSLTSLALPIKLILPSQDLAHGQSITTTTTTTNGQNPNTIVNLNNINGHEDVNSRNNTLSRQQSANSQNANVPGDGRQLLEKGAGIYHYLTVIKRK